MPRITRRNFVTALGAASVSARVSRASATEPASVSLGSLSNRRPNVILMICDDLGYGDLGCYGSQLLTLNLDRMAAEGARFLHYNGGHPICSASRGALMTGRYATRTGIRPVYRPKDEDGIPATETTIASILHDQHYRTMCIGKWHLGQAAGHAPTDHGYDHYFGMPWSVDMKPATLFRDTQAIEEDTDRSLLTPRYAKAAVDFIEENASQPFFLHVAFNYPHIPIAASPRFKGRSKLGIYGDAVTEIDWAVGEVLDALRRKGLDDNTLILFTGDHGPWYQGYTGPNRGRKGTTYEGGFRVPMIMRWHNMIPAGEVLSARCGHLDILPTLAKLCGAKLPAAPLDGVDISSVLAGGHGPPRTVPTLYFSGLRSGFDLQCARLDNWKLRFSQYTHDIYVLGTEAGDNLWLLQPELYDLDADPGESYDVAAAHPDLVRQILAQVDTILATFPDRAQEVWKKLRQSLEPVPGPAGAAARPLKQPAA